MGTTGGGGADPPGDLSRIGIASRDDFPSVGCTVGEAGPAAAGTEAGGAAACGAGSDAAGADAAGWLNTGGVGPAGAALRGGSGAGWYAPPPNGNGLRSSSMSSKLPASGMPPPGACEVGAAETVGCAAT